MTEATRLRKERNDAMETAIALFWETGNMEPLRAFKGITLPSANGKISITEWRRALTLGGEVSYILSAPCEPGIHLYRLTEDGGRAKLKTVPHPSLVHSDLLLAH